MPIAAPDTKKIRKIADWLAPIVRKIAMSRVLFFTSMTIPLMIFIAAIATTMPRMMLMATRSTFSAPQIAA